MESPCAADDMCDDAISSGVAFLSCVFSCVQAPAVELDFAESAETIPDVGCRKGF